MAHKNIFFQQLQQQISRHVFENLEKRFYSGNSSRKYSHKNHLTFWLFIHFMKITSLRSGVEKLNACASRVYHLGIKHELKLATVSEANKKRTADFYREIFHILLSDLRRKHQKKFENVIRILDSSYVTSADKRMAWAKYNSTHHAIKIHLELEATNNIPLALDLTDGKVADITILKNKKYEAGSIVIMDRAYFCSKTWYKHHKNGVIMVSRLKKDLIYMTLTEKIHDENEQTSDSARIVSEKIIQLMGPQSQQFCEHLRVITVDYKTRDGESIEIVTNDMKMPAARIAQLYKQRWQIEVFFKWIKQHLKIKRFLGFNSNAVWIQIWTAMIAYLLIWKYYHEQQIAQKDKITIFQFLTRVQMILFVPDDSIRFAKKPKPPNLTGQLFEKS